MIHSTNALRCLTFVSLPNGTSLFVYEGDQNSQVIKIGVKWSKLHPVHNVRRSTPSFSTFHSHNPSSHLLHNQTLQWRFKIGETISMIQHPNSSLPFHSDDSWPERHLTTTRPTFWQLQAKIETYLVMRTFVASLGRPFETIPGAIGFHLRITSAHSLLSTKIALSTWRTVGWWTARVGSCGNLLFQFWHSFLHTFHNNPPERFWIPLESSNNWITYQIY